MLRLHIVPIHEEDMDNAVRISIDSPLIKILFKGQFHWAILEESCGEGSAEGESWKPVEVY